MKTNKKAITQELNALFKIRFHGAVNIRGIRYQILYSILRAFDLYEEDAVASSLRLEGIEDVDLDLLGLRLGIDYIQVKSSEYPWNWSKLKEPIQSFLKVFRIDSRSHFVLAVNFPLRRDIARLAQIKSLSSNEKSRVENKFRNLCCQMGASPIETDELLSRLTIVSVPEEQIWRKLKPAVADAFGLGSKAVDSYISFLVAKFLDWAQERKTITRSDLDSIRTDVGEALARETEFQAYGRGLIDRISWEPDANFKDFFEGKGTRPGHIVANVDVNRQTWLEKIDRAIISSKICILRSSSGQGKSALMYRYAYDNWPAKNTFILRAAESVEQVELVRNYLRFRAHLGLPLLLLIDNAGWRTRLWPFIAQECAALGIRVLVTVRNEDWHRFARESLMSYEILEPILDMNEARHIFKAFQAEDRLHASVDSPEWVYEKIGEPHLLMEYVYLLTHGRMLEERLRDQIKQFSEQKEDPAKVEILRRTALADVLGAPVSTSGLLNDLQLRDDPQQVLLSLSEEYLKVEGRFLAGLHWVRSDHLAKILHEGYPNPANTALATLEAVSYADIPPFISNALCRQGLDMEIFLTGLVQKAKNANIDLILAFLDGIFEAGERQFYEVNQALFDEAYELLGPTGPSLLSSDFMPVVKVDFIARMAEILEDRAEYFLKLQNIASRISKAIRGIDLCRNFLSSVNPYLSPQKLQANIGDAGRLLDWCFLCEINLATWPTIRDDFIANRTVFDFPLDAFCNFTQGLFRYDEQAYRKWYSLNQEDIIGYLKLQTDCIELKLSDNTLSIEFFIDLEDNDDANEQAVSRLKKLRSTIPFCERYQSQGIWLLPFGLKPSVDQTKKNIPQENLSFESDIEKNVVWRKTVTRHYLPDSYYKYEEAWYNLRNDVLLFVKGLSKGLQKILTRRKFNFQSVLEGGQLLVKLEHSLKLVPSLLPDDLETIGKTLSLPLKEILKEGAPNKWSGSFQIFFIQIFQYIQKRNVAIGKLAAHNFLDAVKYLPKMHIAFDQLFESAPDYFCARELNSLEIKSYMLLADLMDAWVLDPPKTAQRNILQYVKTKRERKRQETLSSVYSALAPLEENGMTIILPTDVYVDHPLRYLPLAFSVDDPCNLEKALGAVFDAIAKIKDIADFFCLIPIHQGARFLQGGYQISTNKVSELKAGRSVNWEAIVPRELPQEIFKYLPTLPFSQSTKLQIMANILTLLGILPAFTEQKNRLENLKSSGNRFEFELYNRYKDRIRDLELNLGIAASEVKDYIKAEFPERQDDPAYKIVWDFLEALEEAVRQEALGDLIASGYFNEDDIVDALEWLLQQ